MEQHPDLIRDIFKVMKGKHFIIEHVNRTIKLYNIFYELSKDLKTGSFINSYNAVIKEFGFKSPEDISNIDILGAITKKRLVEKDLYTFQCDQEELSKMLDKIRNDYIQAWPDPDQHEFLRAVLPVIMTNDINPVVLSLDHLVDKLTEYMMSWTDPDTDKFKFFLEQGLSKYHIGKGIFSMRNSFSIQLAEAASVKGFIQVVSEFCDDKLSLTELDS